MESNCVTASKEAIAFGISRGDMKACSGEVAEADTVPKVVGSERVDVRVILSVGSSFVVVIARKGTDR